MNEPNEIKKLEARISLQREAIEDLNDTIKELQEENEYSRKAFSVLAAFLDNNPYIQVIVKRKEMDEFAKMHNNKIFGITVLVNNSGDFKLESVTS